MAAKEKTPSATVVFEDPSSRAGDKYDWAAIAKQLKAKPGEWGKVFDSDKHSFAVSCRQGRESHPLSPLNGFEQSTRNTWWDGQTRMCALYMRYVPKKDRSK